MTTTTGATGNANYRQLVITDYNEFIALKSENASLKAENAKLRAALEAVEWGDDDWWCPWCNGEKIEGHKPDCQRQTALGLTE